MIHWSDVSGGTLRVLRGVTLSCGCVAGIYETYAGTTVIIIDEADAACALAQHRIGFMVRLEGNDCRARGASPR